MVIIDRIDRDTKASHALRRFGLGAKMGELALARSDPKGFVQSQLAGNSDAEIADDFLQSSAENLKALERGKLAQRLTSRLRDFGVASNSPNDRAGVFRAGKHASKFYAGEQSARFGHGITTQNPLLERLVQFWSNHFAVSARKVSVRAVAGSYEREVIRPNILGSFGQMLANAVSHPAMLLYLDGINSVGPNSPFGQRRGRGLNENLAREVLELHTVGARANYTQQDVTNFARILTGWNVGKITRDGPNAGSFVFLSRWHEPGLWQVMGKTYTGEGKTGGFEVLSDLGRNSATADHIASKLARHFVGDAASQRLVRRLSAVFQESGGNLRNVAETLIDDDEAWQLKPTKVIPPYDLIISLRRIVGGDYSANKLANQVRSLGQLTWSPDSPEGWPDGDQAWVSPLNVRGRFVIASEFATQMQERGLDPRQVASDLFGSSLSGHTASAIARAESIPQGFELLFMSPEFQRR